jgi:hypothetical protein
MRRGGNLARLLSAAALSALIALGAAGTAMALPPPGSDPPVSDDGGGTDPDPAPAAEPAPPTGGGTPTGGSGGVHDVPPTPGGGTNAPPDPFHDAPTPNLHRVAAGLHLRSMSVSTLLTVDARLAVSNPVDVSVLFGSGANATRITQPYAAAGNQFRHDFPADDGRSRREDVVISLLEHAPGGNVAYAVRRFVNLEPLYDIRVSPLTFHEIGHCDRNRTPADPDIKWRDAGGALHREEIDIGLFDGFAVMDDFAGTFTTAGASRGLAEAGIVWADNDAPYGNFYALPAPDAGPPLLPGATHKVDRILPERKGECSGQFTYFVDYTVRTFTLA